MSIPSVPVELSANKIVVGKEAIFAEGDIDGIVGAEADDSYALDPRGISQRHEQQVAARAPAACVDGQIFKPKAVRVYAAPA